MCTTTSCQLFRINCLCTGLYTYSQPTPPAQVNTCALAVVANLPADRYNLLPVGAYHIQAFPGSFCFVFFVAGDGWLVVFYVALCGMGFFVVLNSCLGYSRGNPHSLQMVVPNGGESAQAPLLHGHKGTAVPTVLVVM